MSDKARDKTEPAHETHTRHDVVVVGGGQAGLAIGYFLAELGLDLLILEAADQPAAAWRQRWDSLRLFTPAQYANLPGYAFPADRDHYPGRDEVVDYLTSYAERFDLPVALRSRVSSVARQDGHYRVEVADRRAYLCEQVVVATGAFQVPFVPAIGALLDPSVVQLHSTGYRRPQDIPEGTVLVVGGGNTGFQIAAELSQTHEVHLSVGSRQMPLPQRILGRDLFWYLDAIGLIDNTGTSRLGRRLKGRDTLIGSSPRSLRRRGVQVHGRAIEVTGRAVRFATGEPLEPAAVIWATGFRLDHSWVSAQVFDGKGRLVHRRGVTASPGLYFLGLPLLHTRGSSLLGWVKDDAEYLAQQIDHFHTRAHPSTSSPSHVA